ncbi:MAG: nucleotidyltransferase family protein [Gammaproteobacteria bacterium]|nr:nucleotidyltransferase family protein [Gammaproteobacteria bacterium]MCY4200519.1 nucleotidyltransferase family protein [Gammaproteobacteria bacterium]MCY4276633.1 nucleotidyltransferase family protein [Gammaproteobacteria bacterium]MCY4323143.1 nucleotidyltransferase family protein [Gammaproteobacteria bacterium]
MIAALILAAGYSRRFGSDKRHYRRTSEKPPMLIETLSKYTQAFDPCFVVIRTDDGEIGRLLAAHFDQQVQVIASHEAVFGMGASLADGVRHILAKHTELHGLFVGHGDMPLVRSGSLARLNQTMKGLSPFMSEAILRPEFNGVPGHPVGFTHGFLHELSQLSGDVGAKSVLTSHPSAVQTVDLDDPGICVDFDKPEQ